MRIYVAGKWAPDTITRVREVQAELIAAGHQITYDWTTDTLPLSSQQAINDLHGVLGADVFVLVAEQDVPYCGALVELGMAIGAGLPTYVLGTALDDRCIFLLLGTIRRDEAYRADLLNGHLEGWHARS